MLLPAAWIFCPWAFACWYITAKLRPNAVMNSWQATDPAPPQKSPRSQYITHDRLMLSLQRRRLSPNHGPMGIHITELIIDRHRQCPF